MKKMLMGVLAMLLVLSMGTTVFAKNSPGSDAALEREAEEWNNKVTGVTAQGTNNTIISITKEKVTASNVTSANEAAKSVSSAAEVLGMSDLSVSKSVDTSKGVKVTLSINPNSIKKGYAVYVLHKFDDGKWEILKPSSVTADGKVTVTLYSFSPVAIVQYPTNVNVPTSDPSKNQPSGDNNSNTTNSTENNTNSNNTTGPTQSNSNSSSSSSNSSNSNNQSNNQNNDNNQSNNQNNPVSVNQNVTVNYPDRDTDSDSDYDDGYSDGYEDGRDSVGGTSKAYGTRASGVTTSAEVLSPKTGASLPALPIIAVFALASVAVCGKKAHTNK